MIRDLIQKSAIVASILISTVYAETSSGPPYGVKVLSVDAGSEASKAGIALGDVILSWRQGTVAGSITSPLDLKGIERERGARGTVTLTGRRADKPMIWKIKAEYWGITGGSTVPGVQVVIDRLGELANTKNWDALEQYCRTACMSLQAKPGGRAYALFEAGRWLAGGQKTVEAAEFFSKAIEQEPKARTYFAGQVYGAWADASYKVNDWPTTYRLYRRAFQESQALTRPSLNAAFYLQRLARAKLKAGTPHQAKPFALQALRTLQLIAPKSDLTVRILDTLATISLNADDLFTAQKWLQRALKLGLEVTPKGITLAMVYNSLGNVANARGDLATAEKYYFQCLDLARNIDPQGPMVSNAWGNLGIVFGLRANYRRAEQCHLRALAMEEREGASGELDAAITLTHLASYKCATGDNAGAAKLLQRALAIRERIAPNDGRIVFTLRTYSQVLLNEGDYKAAEEMLSRSLVITNKNNPHGSEAADYQISFGDLYLAQGDFMKALERYRIALDMERQLGLQAVYRANTLAGMAASAKGLGKDDTALGYYSAAFAALDSQSAALDRSDSIHLGSDYARQLAQFVELLATHGQVPRAFEVLDHSRAKTLVRTLTAANIGIVSNIPATLRDRERKLGALLNGLSDERIRILSEGHRKGLSELDAKIASATVERDLNEKQMRAANPHYAALMQPKPPSIRQIQDSLGPNTLLLEYSLGKDTSHLFVADRNQLSAFPLPARGEIERLAKAAYAFWSRPKSNPQNDGSDQLLSNILLGPVAALINGKNRLLVVANGSLQYVPFSALPMPVGSSHENQRLATLYEVVNLPSASLLVTMRQQPTRESNNRYSIAVIGDPVFSKNDSRIRGGLPAREPVYTATRSTEVPPAEEAHHEIESFLNDDLSVRGLQLTRLIHSREEAEAIASVSVKDKVMMVLDFDANRSAATDPRVSNSRIVHFATHGVFDSKNPAMSGLVFSLVDKQGKPQPGFLGLDEIYRLHYSADLVVLSACETALGEEVDSEGLVGLTWGFIYAGAKSVVASLWQVNDASTSELMRIFYAGMEQKGLSPSAALRHAQLAISQKQALSDPYYWAGFVLVGEYDNAK